MGGGQDHITTERDTLQVEMDDTEVRGVVGGGEEGKQNSTTALNTDRDAPDGHRGVRKGRWLDSLILWGAFL